MSRSTSPNKSANTKSKVIVELDGKKYTWDGREWVGEDYLKPPQVIVRRLNGRLSQHLAQEDQSITNVYLLVKRARNARENLQYNRAEELARQILKIDPENHSRLAVLYASLREKGFPQRALDETEPYRDTSNPALLTSRAAAYCDLGMWTKAKRTIGQSLAIRKSEEAFLVVRRIKANSPDLYK